MRNRTATYMKYLCIVILIAAHFSCSKPAYVSGTTIKGPFCTTTSGDLVYLLPIADITATTITQIPAGESIIVANTSGQYTLVNYKNYSGYIYNYNGIRAYKIRDYAFIKPMSKEEYASWVIFRKSTLPQPTAFSVHTTPASAPKSYISSINNSAAKTVHVNGYYRKDGTYVHSYYRRSPKAH
ncbi:MAG TPA: hypothetical protein VFW07_27085 [Parafilimonas sp.]|nr:hypothetical protein [Parafilimonas sp.]